MELYTSYFEILIANNHACYAFCNFEFKNYIQLQKNNKINFKNNFFDTFLYKYSHIVFVLDHIYRY